VLCAALVLGCQKTPDSGQQPANAGGSQQQAGGSEPTPEARLSLTDLNKKLDDYKGKWVVVTARVSKVHRQSYPDGREEATLDLLDDRGKLAGSADFEADQWARAPKLEDGVRYEILGQSAFGKDFGAAGLKKCRFVGTGPSAGPAAEATVSAKDLAADPARYAGKRAQVKGVVRTGTPPTRTPPSSGVLILDGEAGTKWVTCHCAPGGFDKALQAGQGAEVEVVGIVTDDRSLASLADCSVVKATPAGRTGRAVDFTREFARKGTNLEANYKNKSVTLTGKVEAATVGSDGPGKLLLTGFSDARSKNPTPQKVAAQFGPDWKEAVGKVKVGDEVTVSGGFASYQPGEVRLLDCWLIPR
jgi:hypothetical protein